MRISDWSSDVCSSYLTHWHHHSRASCHVGRSPGQLSHRRGGALRKCAVRLTRRLPAPFQPEGRGAGSDLQKGLSYSPAGPLRPPRFFLSSAMMRSEEHTSELQSLMRISYAVFCLKKKKNKRKP